MTTNPDLDQAREVADAVAQFPKAYDPGMQATARVIASLPDEWIDADKLRDVLDRLLQERIRHETANSRGPYVTGYWDGVKIAHTWINEALGGTP
jgi:light-regulated signal transduction histidine kinase (bacteriophytochrome)